jgi:hypothetical protein
MTAMGYLLEIMRCTFVSLYNVKIPTSLSVCTEYKAGILSELISIFTYSYIKG